MCYSGTEELSNMSKVTWLIREGDGVSTGTVQLKSLLLIIFFFYEDERQV